MAEKSATLQQLSTNRLSFFQLSGASLVQLKFRLSTLLSANEITALKFDWPSVLYLIGQKSVKGRNFHRTGVQRCATKAVRNLNGLGFSF